jgi:pyruvate kinase
MVGKPIILSTQIMDSMISRLMPTRAEVSDISNAVNNLFLSTTLYYQVYEGIDCCILAGETATGPFYKEACDMMSRICYEAEQHIDYERNYKDL